MPLLSRAPRGRLLEIVFVGALFAAAFAVRLWPVWQVHFWDEAVYLQNAETICCGKDTYSELYFRPPLISLLYAGAFRIWHDVFAASLVAALLNALGPAALYVAGRLLHGRVAGAIAGALLAFAPFFVTGDTGNSLLTDSPAVSLLCIALALAVSAARGDSVVLFGLAGAVTGLAGLMRFTSLLAVVVLPLYALGRRRPWFSLAAYASGVVVAFAPYLAWSRARYGGFLATIREAQIAVGGSVVEAPTYYLQHFPEILPWLAIAGVALAPVAWLLDRRSADREDRPLAADAILWWWALAVVAYFSTTPHKELRYLLPLAPSWLLLAGRGLALAARPRALSVRIVAAGAVLAALFITARPAFDRFSTPFLSSFVSEEVHVGEFLDTAARPGEVLYANFNYPVLALYSHLRVHLIKPDDRFYEHFPANMPDDGLLVLYKDVELLPRTAWADRLPQFTRVREFPSLIVYRYHRDPGAGS
jgi:4-amino-4-deoxy-L-arabinose transferase-like glycosyltransferase